MINSKKLMNLLGLVVLLTAFSCGNDDEGVAVKPTPEPEPTESREFFTLALSASPTGETKVYTQALKDVSSGTISYEGTGFEMPSTRTARIFSSADGTALYNLDYGGGRIYKFDVKGGSDYALKQEKNVEFAMGTAYPRWTKANEQYASVQYASGRDAVRVWEYNADKTDSTFVRSDVTLRLLSVSLDNLSFEQNEEIIIPVSETDLKSYNYVGRVDAPVIAGNKIYYGMSKSAYNPKDPCVGRGCPSAVYTNTETLMLDYPSLKNPKIISTTMAQGATNGYRTPVAHLDEKGDVYQIVTVSNKDYDTYILRIRDGKYDESFKFNLSELVGENTRSLGWFYTGNGIGYVPYLRTDEANSNSANAWSVARVDLYNGKATKLNLPADLWLQQYQSGVLKDGKFHMAITPTGKDGNVYIFDTTSDSPDGFSIGAKLKNLAEGTYIGIY